MDKPFPSRHLKDCFWPFEPSKGSTQGADQSGYALRMTVARINPDTCKNSDISRGRFSFCLVDMGH